MLLICEQDQIEDPGCFGFELQVDEKNIEGFVVLRDGEYFGYKNSCPHTGAGLDWVEHQFLDMDNALIQCRVHDALFVIDNGECVFGPCEGESLEALPIKLEDSKLYLVI